MRSALLSLLLVGFVAALVGAGTLAYFYDVEQSTGNVFAAGTIDIEVTNDATGKPIGSYNVALDAKPCEKFWYNVTIHNNGTNPTDVYMHITNISDDCGVTTEPELKANPENDINNLSNVTWFDLIVNGRVKYPQDTIKLDQVGCQWIYLGRLDPCKTMTVNMSFHIDPNAGNEYQGDKTTFDLIFKAFQINDPNAPY